MNFSSKIFLDSADPKETREADEILKKAGHAGVEGQTTNPTLVVKRARRELDPEGVKSLIFNQRDAIAYYRKTVEEIASITKGPVSIQVLANANTTTEEIIQQARARAKWIPNGVVKFPATQQGISAASVLCQEAPVNITLTFSQEQAAAAYGATKNHKSGVWVSPFVGRLDEKGENGMDVVANITTMLRKVPDNHVQVLTASVRSVKHILYGLWLKTDAITIPLTILKEWAAMGFPVPPADFFYDAPGLVQIPYKEVSLDLDWHQYNVNHPLTVAGVATFWEDWQSIIG